MNWENDFIADKWQDLENGVISDMNILFKVKDYDFLDNKTRNDIFTTGIEFIYDGLVDEFGFNEDITKHDKVMESIVLLGVLVKTHGSEWLRDHFLNDVSFWFRTRIGAYTEDIEEELIEKESHYRDLNYHGV